MFGYVWGAFGFVWGVSWVCLGVSGVCLGVSGAPQDQKSTNRASSCNLARENCQDACGACLLAPDSMTSLFLCVSTTLAILPGEPFVEDACTAEHQKKPPKQGVVSIGELSFAMF